MSALALSSDLTDEQQAVVDAVLAMRPGQVASLSGGAGTGKSTVVAAIRKQMEKMPGYGAPIITAMTGLAAATVGGCTLHSAMGLTRMNLLKDYEEAYMAGSEEDIREAQKRVLDGISKWNYYMIEDYDFVVTDEMSMLSPAMYDLVRAIAAKAKRNATKPFGGMRWLFVGDFAQLPPVVQDLPRGVAPPLLITHAAFLKDIAPPLCFKLQRIFRQSDASFAELLNRMRLDDMTPEDHARMAARVDAALPVPKPPQLVPHNNTADAINMRELALLGGEGRSFAPMMFRAQRADDCRPTKMPLNVSAARGSCAEYKWKCPRGTHAVSDGACYMPTITKPFEESEFAHLPLAKKVRASTTAAVLASLVKSLRGRADTRTLKPGCLVILLANLERDLPNGSVGTVVGFAHGHPRMPRTPPSHFSEIEIECAADRVGYPELNLPIVEFLLKGGVKRRVEVPYMRYDSTHPSNGKAWVWALPLTLGWATTVHRAQGQSLSFLQVTLDRSVFASGMAYVAASRAMTEEGLSVKAYDPACVKCDPRVKAYYTQDYAEYRDAFLA
jgi:ATP-dependent DNA helicase PIF1